MHRRVRRATHAGSWYSGDETVLSNQLDHWLNEADRACPTTPNNLLAIIAPHAGYRYSGLTAAHSFIHLKRLANEFDHVVLVGPSHHVFVRGCVLSHCTEWVSPLGSVPVATDIISNLLNTGHFSTPLSLEEEEVEHSLEMQLPFIQRCLSSIRIIPILVGTECSDAVIQVLQEHLSHLKCMWVISSDFCHHGPRFRYQPVSFPSWQDWSPSSLMQILTDWKTTLSDDSLHASITALDGSCLMAMQQGPSAWHSVLQTTKNTICGRLPILLALQMFVGQWHFWHYAQSDKLDIHSVSYVAASLHKM